MFSNKSHYPTAKSPNSGFQVKATWKISHLSHPLFRHRLGYLCSLAGKRKRLIEIHGRAATKPEGTPILGLGAKEKSLELGRWEEPLPTQGASLGTKKGSRGMPSWGTEGGRWGEYHRRSQAWGLPRGPMKERSRNEAPGRSPWLNVDSYAQIDRDVVVQSRSSSSSPASQSSGERG